MRNLNEHHHIVLSPAPISLTLSLLLSYWLGGPANSVYVQTEKGAVDSLTMSYLFSTGCFLSAAVIDWKQPKQALRSEKHIKTHS